MVRLLRINISVFITILLLFIACRLPHNVRDNEIKKKFTNKLRSSPIDIEDVIKINGYYQAYRINSKSKPVTENFIGFDTVYSNCIFFNDGLFLHFVFEKDASKKEIAKNLKNHIPISRDGKTKGIWGIFKVLEYKQFVIQKTVY